MAQLNFILKEGTEQLKFFMCRNKVQAFTGGFGNGKTASLAVKSLQIALDYENARCMIGRATRPKLNDSTRKEVLKWTPKDWIKKEPTERDNTLYLHNGSAIEFRHVRQEGRGKGEEQSNLLSNTYDSIAIDQMDDPELTHKDFLDLFGRLRGNARYRGNDESMPKVGPRWLMLGANPTRNWLFREVINPFFVYERTGIVTGKLLYVKDRSACLISVFNAPTEQNIANTGVDFVEAMRAAYKGAMLKRFVDGDWSAYEGLVYPEFNEVTHVVDASACKEYITAGLANESLGVLEGYDYGQTAPSCYLLAFYNNLGDIVVVDGFYEAPLTIEKQSIRIKEIREKWEIIPTANIYADPDIFRGKNAQKNIVGESVAAMFREFGIHMTRGNNNVQSGIAKVSSYLAIDKVHLNPVTRVHGAPRLMFSSELEFLHNEMLDYYWNRNMLGQNVDKPRDINDHAMDTIKYMLTHRPKVIGMIERIYSNQINPLLLQWSDRRDDGAQAIAPRHN